MFLGLLLSCLAPVKKQTKLSFDLFKHMHLVDATATAKDTDTDTNTATRAVPLFSISTAN